MELLIVRHAAAEEGSALRSDARRELTARGRQRMELAVRGLRSLPLRCEVLWHSPWTRAAQTAELLAPLVAGPRVACSALARAPDESLLADLARQARDARRRVRDHGPEELRGVEAAVAPARAGSLRVADGTRIALVGHEPWLTELVAWLTLADRAAGSGLRLGKGGVAWLQGRPEPGGMELRALLPPRVLRQLGRARR